MTLVLTQFTDEGIVMAADTMSTIGGNTYPNATKLYKLPGMDAGVSVWGRSPQFVSPEEWLAEFIEREADSMASINEFAHELEDQAQELGKPDLNEQIMGIPRTSLGFHVAGYESDGGVRFYNIHNGLKDGEPTTVSLADKSQSVNRDFDIVRNGAWEDYAILFDRITEFTETINRVSEKNFQIPYPSTLPNFAKYLGFQIMIVSAIHELSNFSGRGSSPIIGGNIHVLMISPEGVVNGERKTLAIDPNQPEEGIQLRG